MQESRGESHLGRLDYADASISRSPSLLALSCINGRYSVAPLIHTYWRRIRSLALRNPRRTGFEQNGRILHRRVMSAMDVTMTMKLTNEVSATAKSFCKLPAHSYDEVKGDEYDFGHTKRNRQQSWRRVMEQICFEVLTVPRHQVGLLRNGSKQRLSPQIQSSGSIDRPTYSNPGCRFQHMSVE